MKIKPEAAEIAIDLIQGLLDEKDHAEMMDDLRSMLDSYLLNTKHPVEGRHGVYKTYEILDGLLMELNEFFTPEYMDGIEFGESRWLENGERVIYYKPKKKPERQKAAMVNVDSHPGVGEIILEEDLPF
jgi:hypothetical protein